MTIQQTLESLMKGLPHDEAAELRVLIQSWPTDDSELQQLLESNMGEILQLFQQPQLSSVTEQPSISSSKLQKTAPRTLPDFSSFAPLAPLN